VLNVIHEDADLLVVNKPAGLVCHPSKQGELSSLIGRARLYLNARISGHEPDTASNPDEGEHELRFAAMPRLVNRLDRETSGIVLIAKNAAAAGELGKRLESRAVEKEYLAIVHGHIRDDRGLIDAPLGKDEHSRVAIKDCVRPDGASAQTKYWVKGRFHRPPGLDISKTGSECAGEPAPLPFTLVRVLPRTGRKHQIRIHLAHLGHPIVGDKLYGGDEDCYLALVENRLTDAQRAKLIFENHALHARSLNFTWRGRRMEFSCEPERWFLEFIP
jgi:23S rRNA pseudouridine1911/1915/1917 synthase